MKELMDKFPDHIKDLTFVMLTKFGSHLYGTNTENSDEDYKGIFMPTVEQILLGKVPKSTSYKTNNSNDIKNSSDDVEIEVFSLHYFLKLLCEGQTVALDMLHTTNKNLIYSSKTWWDIVERKDKFYTKNLKAFVGYARRQASKYGIKGSRLNSMQMFYDFLMKLDLNDTLQMHWNNLPEGEHIYTDQVDPHGIRMYQICGKKFQEKSRVEYLLPTVKRFLSTYGKRAREAAENKNIDWKAVSHAFRAAIETEEILTDRNITFPLKKADYLLEIKQGKRDYMTEVAPALEELMDKVEILSERSTLPDRVNTDYWDKWLVYTCYDYVTYGWF